MVWRWRWTIDYIILSTTSASYQQFINRSGRSCSYTGARLPEFAWLQDDPAMIRWEIWRQMPSSCIQVSIIKRDAEAVLHTPRKQISQTHTASLFLSFSFWNPRNLLCILRVQCAHVRILFNFVADPNARTVSSLSSSPFPYLLSFFLPRLVLCCLWTTTLWHPIISSNYGLLLFLVRVPCFSYSNSRSRRSFCPSSHYVSCFLPCRRL